ncbi:hypothetical protein V6N13_050741 [Hibiscus sabdariffa]|uniref:Uncharacterized protein n=1 Tax=Hibiscus sabdariffa TaxID=183260 RepID=A0ABR2PI73_9ROSI
MDSKSDLSSSVTVGGFIYGTFKLNEMVVMSVVAVMAATFFFVLAKKLFRVCRSHWTGARGIVQGGTELGGRRSHRTGAGGMVQGEIELGGGRNHGTCAGAMVHGEIELGGGRNHGTGSGGMIQGEIELGGHGDANDGEIDVEAGGAAPE